MKTEIKNQDEVVFEQRNQNYGAFFLRRSYNKNVTRALFVAIFLFLGIISIPLIASYLNENNRKIVIAEPTVYVMKTPTNDILDKAKLPESKPVERIRSYTPPQIVTDPDEETGDLWGLMDSASNQELPFVNDSVLVFDVKPKPKPIDPIPDRPFISVDYMPSFKGGEEAMYDWLRKNVKYPKMAQEVNISGTVHVSFVVEKDGSISTVSLLNDIGGTCGEEALRVITAMPKWNEGRQGNAPVRVQMVLPIRFVLE